MSEAKLNLERQCEACEGKACAACDYTGHVLTEAGEELLAFVARHMVASMSTDHPNIKRNVPLRRL